MKVVFVSTACFDILLVYGYVEEKYLDCRCKIYVVEWHIICIDNIRLM